MGYDVAMQIDIAAEPATVEAALTTTEGIAGWWTTRNQSTATVGETSRYEFPGMPMSWDMKVTEAVPGQVLGWHCTGGPSRGSAPTSAGQCRPRPRAVPGYCSTTPASLPRTRCSGLSRWGGRR